MALARQINSVPTNKVFAGAPVAALVSSAWSEIAVGLGISALAGPGVAALVGFAAALAVAWFIPDSQNIPIVPVEVKPTEPVVVTQAVVPAVVTPVDAPAVKAEGV